MGGRKVIVTGATSFIGRSLISNLYGKGFDVVAIIRPKSIRKSTLPLGKIYKIIEVELNSISTLDKEELEGTDIIFHLGWNSDFENPRYNLEGQLINVEIFQKVVELAYAIGCKKIVSVGSQAECGRVTKMLSEATPDNPETAYAVAKCKAYEWGMVHCKQMGIDLYWPRLLSAYGPYDKERTMIMSCIKAAIAGEEIEFTGCEQIWDYIYVDDVAEALVRIAECGIPGIKYSIASGKGRPLKEYIYEIAKIVGNETILEGIGKKEYITEQVMYLVGDIERLRIDTGFSPMVSFEQGIEKIIMTNFSRRK